MIHSLKKLLKSNYLFTLGILICLGWILATVLAPVIAPYDPIAQGPVHAFKSAFSHSLVWHETTSAVIFSAA